jgi:hypothetical protein
LIGFQGAGEGREEEQGRVWAKGCWLLGRPGEKETGQAHEEYYRFVFIQFFLIYLNEFDQKMAFLNWKIFK